jgi:hypothetical protein
MVGTGFGPYSGADFLNSVRDAFVAHHRLHYRPVIGMPVTERS